MGNLDQFSAVSYVAASALTVGNFCFEDSTDATKVNAAGTAVVGLVPFVHQYATAGVAASMTVPQGASVTPFVMGAIAVQIPAETTVTVGMDVYADQTDGSCIFASSAPESGASATTFKVIRIEDDKAIISNYLA
jgi:hypothetical protein